MPETRGAVPFKRSSNVEAPTRLRSLTAAYVLVDAYKKILQSLTAHMHGCMHCKVLLLWCLAHVHAGLQHVARVTHGLQVGPVGGMAAARERDDVVHLFRELGAPCQP